MINEVVILGSTGSVGSSTLKVLENKRNYKIKLITTNKNLNKALKQAIKYNINDVIVENKKSYFYFKTIFEKKKIKLHLGIKNINKILKNKVTYCINSISGISGLEPTLNIIPLTKNILISNKESIICGWNIINKKLKKFKTNFIPLDSEHYSIWSLIENEHFKNIDKIVLTASGGPFLKKKNKFISNIKPKFALKHPNWKMGKKISIDSSNLMNKIFEFIEAKKIFNLKKNNIKIVIHPSSYVHAIVFLKGNLIKLLAHETKMTIPISNALGIKNKLKKEEFRESLTKLNNLSFDLPKKEKFPVIEIINLMPEGDSYFEVILITLNDTLVEMYLNGNINYLSIQLNLLNLLKKPYFKKYYKLKPNNIYDINNMIMITKNYLKNNIKYYER